ncbi:MULTISPECIES: DUF6879 family protein [unclassified Streptomyces]|uniref:DUF6879 domain-containing protein n=1 Tax=Streptomyces sp. NBC_00060 TaxID=2975636 RepID=A0AAU2H427_9ACTN
MPQNSAVPSFAEMLAGCHVSAVHLEMRDAYGIAAEAAEFEAWKAGDDGSRYDRTGRRRAWLDLVRETVGRGVVMRRARIVSEPVSEYIKYEHAGTPLNIEAGESVRWLARRQASDIALPGNDFWLFDERVVRFNHFTGDGASGGPEVTDAPAVARLCTSAFETVWQRATPHADFKV